MSDAPVSNSGKLVRSLKPAVRHMRIAVVLLAVASIIATFLLLTGLVRIELTEPRLIAIMAGTGIAGLLLFALIAHDLFRLFRDRREGQAGSRLHLSIVGLFTAIAAVPAILVAIVASITLERGLNPWFSGSLRELVTNSGTIARSYQQQLCQNVGREMRLMADEIENARRTGLYDQNRTVFRNFLTTRAIMLGFPFVVIMHPDGTILERADTRQPQEPLPPRDQDFKDAATSEPPCMLSAQFVGAMVQLNGFDNSFLYVARRVDQRALTFDRVADDAVQQYNRLDAQRLNVQRAFMLMYAIVTLMLLLIAIWIALAFADRLVAPIRRLITATDAVSSGNLYVQVPVNKSEGDISHLGQTFNHMIAEIRGQQNRLMSASEALDKRRQFTEAVLSGVSVGVIGLDEEGRIGIANPSAEAILGATLSGSLLSEISPEIDKLFQEARHSRARGLQRHMELNKGGRDMTLFVRVTSEQAKTGGGVSGSGGYVVTIDDISNLVTAQRTSAWADVARRIAHEIKNPLTPIQLSAERIKRKYGKLIVEDRDVFDQCTATIVRQVDDIRRMVDEFSSFARMPKPTPEQDDLVDVLRQAIFLMRVAHPQIAFEDKLPKGAFAAKFDRRLIGQAVQNILKNATEGIAAAQLADKGCIEIAIAETSDPATGADQLQIEITDNGVGFPTENRQRLLEPYMTTREGGTGLGLAIVAKIFEDHGGGIALLDNPAGRGARVRLTMAKSTDRIAAEGGSGSTRTRPAASSASPNESQGV
jgi:two-component system, NtrC family, nitrogen regulation sensor histidine kinase NtrY